MWARFGSRVKYFLKNKKVIKKKFYLSKIIVSNNKFMNKNLLIDKVWPNTYIKKIIIKSKIFLYKLKLIITYKLSYKILWK